MTDIELRKAESLWLFNEWIKSPLSVGFINERHVETIRELLQPSPQSPDSEVDEAIEDFCRTWLHCGMEEAKTLHAKWWAKLQAVKEDNAAQQPRQEWMDISTAPRDGSRFLGIDKSGYIEVVFQSDEEDYFTNGARWDIGSRNSSDRHVKFEITHWQPSPSPPKEK